MKRKIVRQGGTALTVTLPSKWTQEHALKAGDDVDIQHHGKNLVISSQHQETPKYIELDTIKLGSFYYHYLGYYYKLGYDEVRIIYNNPKVFQEVKQKTADLLGFEITETGRNSVTVRSVSHESPGEFDTMLRRTFLLAKTLSEECLAALRQQDTSALSNLQEVERTTNKLTDFCIRILHKHGHEVPNHTLSLYALLRELEQLCDHYHAICHTADTMNGHSFSPALLHYFSSVNQYYCLFYELFYKFDEEKANALFSNKERLLADGNILFQQVPKEEHLIAHHLVSAVQQLFNLKGPYFQMELTKADKKAS